MFGAQGKPEWRREISLGIIGAQYLFLVGMIGVDSLAGSQAFANHADDFDFIQRFEVFPNQSYPDGGATVECWTTGLGE